MKLSVKVLGQMRVNDYLNLDARFDKRRAFTRAGLQVEHSARMKSPYRTGHLRRNIVSQADDKEAEIGVDLNVVPYAWYQEAGTSRMSAHPYLRPGLESSRNAIVRIFQDEMHKAINGGTA